MFDAALAMGAKISIGSRKRMRRVKKSISGLEKAWM